MGVAIGFWKGTGILHLPRFLPGLIMLTCLFFVNFQFFTARNNFIIQPRRNLPVEDGYTRRTRS